MAKNNSTAMSPYISSNLKVDNYCWGEIYKGTKEDLIAANLIKDGEFPSDVGNNKYALRIRIHTNGTREVINGKYNRTDRLENIICVRKTGKKFEVWINASDEEQEKRGLIKYMKNRGFDQTINDAGFTKFMYMVFNSDWYEDKDKFRKAARH